MNHVPVLKCLEMAGLESSEEAEQARAPPPRIYNRVFHSRAFKPTCNKTEKFVTNLPFDLIDLSFENEPTGDKTEKFVTNLPLDLIDLDFDDQCPQLTSPKTKTENDSVEPLLEVEQDADIWSSVNSFTFVPSTVNKVSPECSQATAKEPSNLKTIEGLDFLTEFDLLKLSERRNSIREQSTSLNYDSSEVASVDDDLDPANLSHSETSTVTGTSESAECEKLVLKSRNRRRLRKSKCERNADAAITSVSQAIQTKQIDDSTTWKVCLRFHDITGSLTKEGLVEIISDVSGFKLNESVINLIPIDRDTGMTVVLVKCPTMDLHDDFLQAALDGGISACSQISGGDRNRGKTGAQTSGKIMPRIKVNIVFTGLGKEHMKADKGVVVKYIRELTDFELTDEDLEADRMNGADGESLTFKTSFKDEISARNFVESINEVSSEAGLHASIPTVEDLAVENLWEEIFDRAQSQVEHHHRMLTEVSDELSLINGGGKGKKWMNIQEFEMKKAKAKPLQIKLEELREQEIEFSHSVDEIQAKIFELKHVAEFQPEANRLRTEFQLEMKRFASALPMYAKRTKIIETVRNNRVGIILGETGSGKSTQILQYLHYAGFTDKGLIVCTQPRKVAAVSLANRVAEEMGCRVGQLVGYQVGMKVKKGPSTKILFVTDHILLNSCLKDPLFSEYACVVIDEAHERSIYTDLLLGFIKRSLSRRDDLKVLITSATINPEVFVRYFGRSPPPPLVEVPGRVFPVEVVYEKYKTALEDDYLTAAVSKAVWIHENLDPGDVLVFLTSPLETEKACKNLLARCGERHVVALEVNGRLQLEDQQKVFAETPPGKRKIVFATNSAETSVTIPGIKYVVDTGRIREMNYDPKKRMSVLSLTWTTKSSADQRKGRAGRTDCGHCFRLYTEDQYAEMRKDSVPEILRINLGQALLKLLMLGISDPGSFDFVESPKQEAIEESLELLEELGAYSVGVGITEIGKQLAQISVEPRLGKVVLRGIEEGIGYEAMILTAVCSAGGSVFFRGGSVEDKNRSDRTKTRFCDEWGDSITGAMIYKEWDTVPMKGRGSWCKNNNINGKTMKVAQDILKEIYQTFQQDLKMIVSKELSVDPKLNEKLAMVLFDCYPSSLARFLGHERVGYCLASNSSLTLRLHPSSSLLYLGELPKWVVYEQIITTTDTFMTNVTHIDDSWVADRLSSGKLSVNMKELEEEIPVSRKITGLGKHCIAKLLEQKAQGLKDLEKKIKDGFPDEDSRLYVHLDANKRCIELYTDKDLMELAFCEAVSYVSEARRFLKDEMLEERIRPGSDVRFVLGSGLTVRSVLMPNEQRQVSVFSAGDTPCDMQQVRDTLSRIGEIESYTRSPTVGAKKPAFNNTNSAIGYVTFKNADDAASAITAGHFSDFRLEFSTKSSSAPRSRSAHFSVKVEICRRPLTGNGHVQFRTTYARNGILSTMDSFMVKKRVPHENTLRAEVLIMVNRRNPEEAFLKGIPSWATPDVVRQSLVEAIADDSLTRDITNIFLIRIQPPSHPEDALKKRLFQDEIRRELVNAGIAVTRDYEIELNDPKEKDFTMFAHLRFTDHDKADIAADVLNGVQLFEQRIEAKLDLKTSFTIQGRFFGHCIGDVRAEVKSMNKTSEGVVNLQEKRRDNGSYLILVEASEASDLKEVRTRLESVIHGQRIDLISGKFLQLKSDDGFRKRAEIERTAGVRIRPDDRLQSLIIYGKMTSVDAAKLLIEEYLNRTKSNIQKDLDLRDSCYPRGILKTLVSLYGLNLEKLKSQSGAFCLDLNLKRHAIKFNGLRESFDHLKTLIAQTADLLPGPRQDPEPTPECPVCLNNIDYDDCYVVESCGHFYCTECCSNLVRNGLTSNEIPITCALDDCKENLTLRDLQNLLPSFENAFEPAIRSFMVKNNKEFAYCSTPDCPSFYRKTVKHAEEFACSICHVSLCTKCDASYHPNMTCEVFSNFFVKADDNIKVWLREDLERRALCPKCGIGIEKAEGCNHVECKACKAHICWKCKKFYATSDSCYQHLRVKHGGYYDDAQLNEQIRRMRVDDVYHH